MFSQRTRVVYVAGSGHTGSTLLALLLDSHPEIACVGEVAIKPGLVKRGRGTEYDCSCGTTVAQCPFWTQVFALVRQQGHDFGPSRWTNDYRFANPLAQRLLQRATASSSGRAFVRWAADRLPIHRDRVHRADAVNLAFISAVLATSGAQVFADTSKRLARLVYLRRLPQLDIKLVLLIRDVRGYAASAKRRGLPAADAARTWLRDRTAATEIAEDMGPGRVHRLHYEDMCGALAPTLQRLWAFCGVSEVPPDNVVEAVRHHVMGNAMRLGGQIRVRLDESWRERLDARETRDILAIAGDVNRSLGYE